MEAPVSVIEGEYPEIKELLISPEKAELMVGEILTFRTKAIDVDGNSIEVPVIWSVRGEIGRITATGEFTAMAVGAGYVIATAGTVSSEAPVNVIEGKLPEIRGLLISPEKAELMVGEILPFRVDGKGVVGGGAAGIGGRSEQD